LQDEYGCVNIQSGTLDWLVDGVINLGQTYKLKATGHPSFVYRYYVSEHYPSPCVYLKHHFLLKKYKVSETGFCIHLQVKPTQLGSID
jgi:hypothetical protein